jgi:hypothetical protein
MHLVLPKHSFVSTISSNKAFVPKKPKKCFSMLSTIYQLSAFVVLCFAGRFQEDKMAAARICFNTSAILFFTLT